MFNQSTAKTKKYYSYGAYGVDGAMVELVSEDRSSCYLDIDLGKKNHEDQTFWQGIWNEKLRAPGDIESWCLIGAGQTYYSYRLRINSQGWRCSDDDKVTWDYWWLPSGC